MIFLHGGGDNPDCRMETFGRFAHAATADAVCRIALVVAEPTPAQADESVAAYRAIFASLPMAAIDIQPVVVSATTPLRRAQLESMRPTGVFICGGNTPYYHQSLCHNLDWVAYLAEADIPYGGTSAGAAIAAQTAILGGWQTTRNNTTCAMLFQGASEGLDPLTVRAGLGLVPFGVDVHASQMGTLTRLIHAVEAGLMAEGWGIDENTLLHIEHQAIRMYGQGHGYRVWRDNNQGVQLAIFDNLHYPGS